ncbi:heterokaryon incompatibility protein-domain-containing protein [Cercophora newfieldiana]|uniref:Heterokaryon incompatibility protein-domain-containing protein n=1 Tax=Cercophora newfieldiana TaxID=92897 RepID=A0AA39XRL8_9PEZI|nr:heterokaryon incompatibility protein-domain-containing protein [Cercophora newfieldiana]
MSQTAENGDHNWAKIGDSPATSNVSESQTCDLCSSITAEALVSDAGFAHVKTVRDLENTKSTCRLCSALYDHYERWPRKQLGNSRLRLKVEQPPAPPYKIGSFLRVTALSFNSEGDTEACKIRLFVVVPLGHPTVAFDFPQVNTALTNTRSDETFTFIQDCIDRCLETHHCSRPLSELLGTNTKPELVATLLSDLPARLIDVSSSDTQHTGRGRVPFVRLVDVNTRVPPLAQDAYIRYLTLSHCWGSGLSEDDKTEIDSLEERKRQIRISSLCKNFQDAVEITRRLGERYLWIDALCIVQDSDADKATEIAKMGNIYQNAFLNIAAGLKGDSSGGCFNKESRHTIPRMPYLLFESTKTTHRSTTPAVLLNVCGKAETGPLLELRAVPLADRGWIYQERILSPRILHFTQNRLIWECRSAYWMEDMMPV